MGQYTVNLAGGGQVVVNASDPAAALENAGNPQGATVTAGSYTGGSSQPSSTTPSTTTTTQGAGIDALLQALQNGDTRAFDEFVRQFNATHGLDVRKFEDDIRRWNETFGITQAGVTGTYQGNPTLPALTSYATQFGTWGVPQAGQQTLAAQNQAYQQQLGAITTAAGLQANPFRQAQVIGQLGNLLRGSPVAGFQAPGQAQGQTDFSGMGNMQRLIDDIRGGPNAINSASTQSVLDAIPTPNKVNSVDFYRSSPNTQNIVLQGMNEKYGLSPEDALAQIRNTLPQFQSPTTFGGVKR